MAGMPSTSLTEWLSRVRQLRSGIQTISMLASSRSMYSASICAASLRGRAMYRRPTSKVAIRSRRCSRRPTI
ncbi:hypothetical protein D3C81_1388560 [compost metagenome]